MIQTGILIPDRNAICDPESVMCSSQILFKSIRVPIIASESQINSYMHLTGAIYKIPNLFEIWRFENHSIFEFCTIFHTKVLKDGPTPEIGATRVEYLWVGSMPPNKETGGSGPLGIRNQAADKKKGSNVGADFRCHQVGQKIEFRQ